MNTEQHLKKIFRFLKRQKEWKRALEIRPQVSMVDIKLKKLGENFGKLNRKLGKDKAHLVLPLRLRIKSVTVKPFDKKNASLY